MSSYIQDTDKGLQKILREIKKFKDTLVKVGVIEGSGDFNGVAIAEYATWNENGVMSKKGKWKIPPRPFVKGWADSNKDKIASTITKLFTQVQTGEIDADIALKKLGQFGQDGIKSYIRNGDFTPNAKSTIDKKGSSKPLIDTGTLRNSIRYEVVK